MCLCLPGCATQAVVVSGTAEAQTTSMGVFQVHSALTSGGRLVFKNSNGAFLYYWPALLNWRIGSNITSDVAGVKSTGNIDMICPEDSSGWEEFAGKGNWVKSSITVLAGVCLAAPL